MNPTSTPHPDADHRTIDVRGWLILAWVVVWSAAYFHFALATRFPWLRSWLGWFS
ncbi:hypothetical protein [Paludisphaera rhizosphaerae]|uniref:hypothetical protein n=1 Tax=Paludisphaera rhizosphaerae TaxID=2711216 RepID=UPI0013EE216F|nr:hypothetical protein [Paludisphaera rhizosphaerae]